MYLQTVIINHCYWVYCLRHVDSAQVSDEGHRLTSSWQTIRTTMYSITRSKYQTAKETYCLQAAQLHEQPAEQGDIQTTSERRWKKMKEVWFHDLSWSFIIFHDLSWSFMIFHDLSWSFMIFGPATSTSQPLDLQQIDGHAAACLHGTRCPWRPSWPRSKKLCRASADSRDQRNHAVLQGGHCRMFPFFDKESVNHMK